MSMTGIRSIRYAAAVAIAMAAGCSVFSQNMNSPYSVYGIGDIDSRSYNRTSGMAGTGLALRSSSFLIDNNPAAITGLPRSFYTAHVATTGRFSSFSGDPIDASNSQNRDMWIKRFELAVKINGFWASSVGFSQFSNINYRFSGNQFLEGTATSYKTSYEGDGGLNDYHWTNAVSLGRHLSAGIKSSIIAGAINQSETLSDAALQSVITTHQQDYIGDLRFQGGLLYEGKLNKKWDFSLGGRYAPKTRFSAQRTLTVTENGEPLIEDEYIKSDRFYLPATYAAGIALKKNKVTTFAADYTYEDWSSLHIKESGWQLISSHRVSGGVEFSKQRNQWGVITERRFFQAGAFYSSSSLQVRNTPVREYGLTAGMGGALGNNLLYSFSLEAGTRGTTAAKLIKENYIGFTLNLSYRDFLFSKGRKYD
ncbi:MAG: hypothetical protein ABW019_11285 [Chitinophagaceae bacterium]